MPLPPPEQRFRFKIQAPFGEETLYVFTTDQAEINLPGRRLETGLSLIEAPISEIKSIILGQSRTRFGDAVLKLVSRPH